MPMVLSFCASMFAMTKINFFFFDKYFDARGRAKAEHLPRDSGCQTGTTITQPNPNCPSLASPVISIMTDLGVYVYNFFFSPQKDKKEKPKKKTQKRNEKTTKRKTNFM